MPLLQFKQEIGLTVFPFLKEYVYLKVWEHGLESDWNEAT